MQSRRNAARPPVFLEESEDKTMKKWSYEAKREGGAVIATVNIETNEGGIEKFPLHHFARHSPSGFEFGYGGSGPADLAYSILVHWFLSYKFSLEEAKEEAAAHHQEFKRDFIAIEDKHLVIADSDIKNWWGGQEETKEAATA